MKTLYILNNPQLFEQCTLAMGTQDALLLIEDAVVLSEQQSSDENHFVLEEDLIARGLNSGSSWNKKNYNEFVALTLEYNKSVSWL
ncbi:sulfurtransferase complex subunit TusB [Kangiella sp. HD9-110m-PIT-SAG07]|nr:sulfurtransferase complex subunit TusB [Kangiella sp. HD9-110m-PIT-SAG07]